MIEQLLISYFNNINLKTAMEMLATLLTILYVLGATIQKRWAMLCGFLGSALYVIVFFISSLYYETILNVYYAIIGLWGFILWKNSGTKSELIHVSTLGIKKNIIIILLTGIATILFYIIAKHTRNASAILDSIVFAYSIPATYMQMKKIIENWLYFIVINFISIAMLISQQLYSTVLLVIVLNILAIIGYYSWRKSLKLKKFV